jgi:biotin operon repressor
MREEQVLTYLQTVCEGRENTKKSVEIQRALKISENELRHQINRLRCRGIPVASSRDGYFLAVTAGEVYSTIRLLQKKIKGMEAAISGLEWCMNRFVREEGDPLG